METKHVGNYEVCPNAIILGPNGPLTKRLNSHGYQYVRLVLNGKRKQWNVHSLMASLFLSERPTKQHEVRHLDGNRLNNRADNLAWGTRQDNADDREKHGKTARGRSHSDKIKKAISQSKEVAKLEEKLGAAFIVRACNAHDELLAALNKIHSGSFQNAGTLATSGQWRDFVDALQKIAGDALDSLAKARGEA